MNSRSTAVRPATLSTRALLVGLSLVLPLTMLSVVADAPPAQAVPAPTAVSAKIDFTTAAGTLAAGFARDSGAAYNDGASPASGWVREDSLSGTRVGLDLTPNTRVRTNTCTGTVLPEAKTFIHMDNPTAQSATNNPTPGAYEYAVPNGQYRVEVGYGDANPGADPESHSLNVEGQPFVTSDPASPATTCIASRLRKAVGWVAVNDGRLTVDSIGGTNTKLGYVTIDSVPVADVQPVVSGGSVTLSWPAVDGASSYKVWRSETLPLPGGADAVTATLLASPSSPTYTDTTATKGVLYHYSVGTNATTAPLNGTVVQAIVDDPAPTQPALPLKVDFGTRAMTVAADYVGDAGRGYSNAAGFGWVHPGTQVPLNLIGNGRVRTNTTFGGATGATTLNSSMIHAQYPATGATQGNGVHRLGAWQAAVPNGLYEVTVSVGEREPGTDPTRNVVNLEGTRAVDYVTVTGAGVATTGADRFRSVTTEVEVTDGFLTLDTLGGTNTKLTDLTITALTDPKPAVPTGLTAAAGDAQVTLDWADNDPQVDDDLQGYDVFRGATAAVATTGTPLNGTTPVTDSTFVDTTAVNGTTYHYVVVAVDDADQRSAASDSASATPDAAQAAEVPVPFRLNFSDGATTPPTGFLKDSGQAFTNTRGYGWVRPGTSTPLDLSANGRLRPVRAVDVDLRQRGLVHMQGDDVVPAINGTPIEGAWEVAVADGSYRVTVSVGDQPGATSYDSQHSLDVEGEPVISRFQGTAAAEFRTATEVVEVTDGRLTIDAADGTNTKINFVDVEVADLDVPAAPTGVVATGGDRQNVVTWEASPETDVVGHHVYSSTSEAVEPTPANRSPPPPRRPRRR